MRYSEEFKLQAVAKVLEENKTRSAVARELGVSLSTIRNWVDTYSDHPEQPFVGSGKLRNEDARIKALEKENRDLKEDIEILKKAAAIFAKKK